MSDEMKDGGFAFPYQFVSSDREPCEPMLGMTLRDWFAGQALAAYIQHLGAMGIHAGSNQPECVSEAYSIADAMLKERSK